MDKLLKLLGPVSAVIGAQWGDEGKGKVIDILTEYFDVIARSAGGANAGHTIVVDGEKHVFHLLPAGSLHEGKQIVLGAGMVIHLPTLLEEIETLEKTGRKIVSRLFISKSTHIVFEYHKAIDALQEERRSASGSGIGTTKRGIGPAYADKAARSGIRMEVLTWPEDRIKEQLMKKADEVKILFGIDINIEVEFASIKAAKKKLGANIHPDELPPIFNFLGKKRLLIEGAQATLLDIDHGTYPYVTSSSTTAAGAMQGLGLPPNALTSCIGVAKAYCTRVGSGEFATEVTGETGDRLRERGGEYGATTGRPRRCGWLDLVDLRLAAAINGLTCWNITKLDVLDEEGEIPVAVERKGSDVTYKKLPGWKTSTRGITDFKKLPKNAQAFIELIEKETKVPVSLIGTGPGREEMIIKT